MTTPQAMRDALGDFVDRCDPPEPELPFLLVCAKFPEGSAGGQPASVALQAHATRGELRRQAEEARRSFEEPIPDDPADPENDPTYESGVLLGDTWTVLVTYNGPVQPILAAAQNIIGGEIVADGKYLEDFDEVLRRLGTAA